jgi:cyclase
MPELIAESARRVGNQSIVVVLDVKKTGMLRQYKLFTHNGMHATGLNPSDFARKAEALGAGEILVNAIEQDGMMTGYDLTLIEQIREAVSLPLSVLGGAGTLADLHDLIRRYRIIGAAAGSLFVLKGKYRAVLIQYPVSSEKEFLFNDVL